MSNVYSFLEDLNSSPRPFIGDGAMGTMLHQRGQGFQHCFDLLNLTQPSLVAEIHHEYIDAGAQIIQTNTFGANRFKLSKHELESRLLEINTAAVELARRVVLASFKKIYIAGDIGPLGVRLAPFGRVQPEEARDVFREQIAALVKGGIDLLIIETMTDLYEIREAILAAREVDEHLPILASMTFTRDDRTLLGDSPEKVADKIKEAGADLIGVNCSGGPDQILRVLKAMRQAVPDGKFSAMPNAGWPEQVSGRIFYPATPEYFGDYAVSFWQAGARVIGGCCGTTPTHITQMRNAVDSAPVDTIVIQPVQVNGESEEYCDNCEQPTQLAQKLASGKFIFAVEMDPPRGLATQKLLAGASLLAESGADVIDVADSPMARMRMSPWAVCSLIQKTIGVETVLHFPTRGRNLLRVQGDLLAAHAIGVRNIFVIMGDPTAIGDYPNAADNFDLVPSGLIRLIKEGFNAGVDHSGSDIGQPTSFFVGCALNLNPSNPKQEARNLHRKLESGADFILTQPVFDAKPALEFLETFEKEYGVFITPLLLGILPLHNFRHANFLHQEVPGVNIPAAIMNKMEHAGEKGPHIGAEIASALIQELRPRIQGVYLMPAFNRYDITAGIIEANK
jgi:methionine synthase I (cobalamin-dependent)/5,10-methylenetetrahydrofolate reductase